MSNYYGPITNTIIDAVSKEINKKKTKEKIMTGIIDPLLYDLTKRYYPHLITITIVMVIILLLLVSILALLILQRLTDNDECNIKYFQQLEQLKKVHQLVSASSEPVMQL